VWQVLHRNGAENRILARTDREGQRAGPQIARDARKRKVFREITAIFAPVAVGGTSSLVPGTPARGLTAAGCLIDVAFWLCVLFVLGGTYR